MAGFVWKPTSEKDGNLVVLFPAGSSAPPTIYVVTANGDIVQGQLEGLTNGDRPTYRFPDNGAAYGSNVGLIGPDGQTFGITNGAQRYDDGNPPAPLGSEGEFAAFQSGGAPAVAQSQQSNGGSSSNSSGGTNLGSNPRSGDSRSGGSGDSDDAGIRGRSHDGRRFPDSNQEENQENSVNGQGSSSGSSGTGNNIGFEPKQGFAFPQSDFSTLSFTPITPTFVPPTPVVDPIERTQEVGIFNRLQNQINFDIAKNNALELTQLEFDGLQSFNRQARGLQQEGITEENTFNQGQVSLANEFNRSEIPAANEFNQGQIAGANTFNQDQRLSQLEVALPGAADTINRQIERGSTLAEGRFISDAEDRAFEVTARSASADGTIARGFGDDSVFGQRASELLSAEQRLQLSQSGEQTLNRFLTLGANLSFDQPIKQNPVLNQPLEFQPQQARTSQDVRGAPSVPTSTLAVAEKSELNQLSTISPVQAISFDINQNQFQSGVDKFNSTLDFESQSFNSTTGLKVDLEKLYAETFNAQQESSAINLGIQTGITQQQFEQQLNAGQQASQNQALGNILGAGIGLAAGYLANQEGSSGGGRSGSGSSGSNNATITTGNGVIVDDFSNSPDVEFDPSQNSDGDIELQGEFQENEDGSFTFTPSAENSGGGSGGYGGGYSPGFGSSSGGSSSASSERGLSQEESPQTAKEIERAVAGDEVARQSLENRLARTAPDTGLDAELSGAEAGGDGATDGAGTSGDLLAFLNNLYNYQQDYDELSDTEKVAGGAQLVAAAGVLAGVISGPVGAIVSGIADVVVTASNWDDYSDSQKASVAIKYSGASINSPGGFDYNIAGLVDSAGQFFGFSTASLVEDAFGSNKSKDQKIRDAMRDHGEDKGLFVRPDQAFAEANGVKEGSHQVQLADGSYYDVGVDGRNELQNYGTNIDGRETRNSFDIDWSDPRASEVVGMLNPFASMLYGDYAPKFMGHLVNAATSNNASLSETKQNVKHFVESTGLTYEMGLSILRHQLDNEVIDSDSYYAFVNGWNGLMLSDGVEQEIVI